MTEEERLQTHQILIPFTMTCGSRCRTGIPRAGEQQPMIEKLWSTLRKTWKHIP